MERERLYRLLLGTLLVHVPLKLQLSFFIMNNDNNFQSSINDDNPCSRSTALIVVQSLHIFQEHIIAVSFLFLLHWPFFQTFLLWTTFRSSSIKCCSEKNKSKHWTLTEQNSPYRCLFAALPVRNRRGDKGFQIHHFLFQLRQRVIPHVGSGGAACFYALPRLIWCCEDCRKIWTSYEEGNDWRFYQEF